MWAPVLQHAGQASIVGSTIPPAIVQVQYLEFRQGVHIEGAERHRKRRWRASKDQPANLRGLAGGEHIGIKHNLLERQYLWRVVLFRLVHM